MLTTLPLLTYRSPQVKILRRVGRKKSIIPQKYLPDKRMFSPNGIHLARKRSRHSFCFSTKPERYYILPMRYSCFPSRKKPESCLEELQQEWFVRLRRSFLYVHPSSLNLQGGDIPLLILRLHKGLGQSTDPDYTGIRPSYPKPYRHAGIYKRTVHVPGLRWFIYRSCNLLVHYSRYFLIG